MNVFTTRNVQSLGRELPLWCPIDTFPETAFKFTQKRLEKRPWEPEDVIAFLNTDIYGDHSIDLASMFSRARETEQTAPSENCGALEDLMKGCKADIQALNSKIPELLITIMKLCQEVSEATSWLARKRDQVNIIQYILSPPKHLPHDVLEQIFFWCRNSVDPSDPCAYLVPMRLASVCHRWRSVALSMSFLWSRIQVTMTDKQSVYFAKLFISRCHNPSLTLTLEQDRPISVAEDFVTFLNGLPIHIPHLSVVGVYRYPPEGLLAFIEQHSRTVEELVLLRTNCVEYCDAPQVKRLFITGLPVSWMLPGPNQFPELRHLRVLYSIGRTIPIHILDIILRRCSRLQRLSVAIQFDRDETAYNLPAAHQTATQVHEYLEYLCFSHAGRGDVPKNLLHNWHFLNLESLHYEVRTWQEEASTEWLLKHLSHIRLLILNFESGHHQNDNFLSILRAAPLLEYLVLSGSFSDAVTLLSDPPGNSTHTSTVPDSTPFIKLKKLHIIFPFDTQFLTHTYRPRLQTLYTTSLHPSRGFTHLIIEVHFQKLPANPEDVSPFLAYIKNTGGANQQSDGVDETSVANNVENISTKRMELQVRWRMNQESPLLGRFWPLPFDRDEAKFGVLSDDGVWSTRTGFAYQ